MTQGSARLLPRTARAALAAGPALLRCLPSGAALGESSVASLRVHVLSAADPDAVWVLRDRDAGQVFYGRRQPGQVVHIDIFHAPGVAAPGRVATAFARAVAEFAVARGAPPTTGPDWFDVQTAAGGGRLGGPLRGGRRESVRAAHRGHVHLAGRLPAAEVSFLFFLVAAVEQALVTASLAPRRLLRVCSASAGTEQGPLSPGALSEYEALDDTWLRDPDPAAPRPAPAPSGGEPRPVAPPAGWLEGREERLLAAASRLAEACGGADQAAMALQALFLRPSDGVPTLSRDAVAHLIHAGCAERAGPQLRLTALGAVMRTLFAHRLREVELALRACARGVAQGRAGARWPARADPGGRRRTRGIGTHLPGDRLREIAAPDTLAAAAARSARTEGARGIRVRPSDLRVRRCTRPRRVDLCLLLDASASMEGGRMRAAKTLATHLLLTGRGRVAVMTFQERACALPVPMTRRYAAAERGLSGIAPSGLTPMAAGLRAAREYLVRSGARRTLLLLVTDGIPTASLGGGSPLEEALVEAGRLREARIPLCCIGLEPNEHYLSELACRAGGRLHVVAELRPDVLAQLARRERARLEVGQRRWAASR